MDDAVANLEPTRLNDFLYANDTIVTVTNAKHIGQFAAVIERMGAKYKISLHWWQSHWGQTRALSILSTDRILQPDGSPMTEVSKMKFLGAILDGHA